MAALVLAGALLIGSGLAGAGTASAAGAVPATPDAAATGFASCLQGQKSGDLLLLIDDSSSLQGTDPQAARVKAATYMLTQLGGLTEWAKVELDVAVAGFSDDFRMTTDWTKRAPRRCPL